MLTEKAGDNLVEKPAEKSAVERIVEKRRALGRGLESLLPGAPRAVAVAERAEPGVVDIHAQAERKAGQEVLQLKLDEIVQNPYQTRLRLDQAYLTELAASIRAYGVLQPVTVRPAKNGKYALIAGECRWKASSMAGKDTIPAIVRVVSDQQSLELTIIENLQRQDLNCLEQALAFERLSREFQLTQEEIALKTGMERSTVGNYMRLLRLPEAVREHLKNGMLTFSQIKTIMRLEDPAMIPRVAEKAAKEETSVRDLEEIVFNLNVPVIGERKPGQKRYLDPNVRQAQTDMERILGVRVKIRDTKGKGSITLQYRNLEDFDRVVGMLSGK
jgi:ParB family transcriptional regulator, chromosome partitioning protein